MSFLNLFTGPTPIKGNKISTKKKKIQTKKLMEKRGKGVCP